MIACLTVVTDWMATTAATNWITLAGFVLAVWAFLYQGHATRKQSTLQNLADYTKRYQEIILNFPETINEASFSLETLPDDRRNSTLRYMRAYFDLCAEELALFNQRYIDAATWALWKEGMEFAFSKPAFRQSWAVISKDTHFGAEFKTLVEHAMKQKQ